LFVSLRGVSGRACNDGAERAPERDDFPAALLQADSAEGGLCLLEDSAGGWVGENCGAEGGETA